MLRKLKSSQITSHAIQARVLLFGVVARGHIFWASTYCFCLSVRLPPARDALHCKCRYALFGPSD